MAELAEIFENVEDDKKKLVEGLMQEDAFLYAENHGLRALMTEHGMLKVNPNNTAQQKETIAAKQYLKNINSYAVVIKTLNSILDKNMKDEDDEDMSAFE